LPKFFPPTVEEGPAGSGLFYPIIAAGIGITESNFEG